MWYAALIFFLGITIYSAWVHDFLSIVIGIGLMLICFINIIEKARGIE